MIKSLRSAHRVAALLLATLVPAGFLLGLAARRPMPVEARGELGAAGRAGRLTLPADLWGARRIHTSAAPGEAGSGASLWLEPSEALELPDVIVYWAPNGPAGPADRLPEDARPLGRIAGTEERLYRLPVPGVSGRLYLYSLAHGELVASASLDGAAR